MDMREIYDKMLDKASKDDNFRSELLAKPKEALKKINVDFPDDVDVEVYEMTDDHLHFVLPQVQGV